MHGELLNFENLYTYQFLIMKCFLHNPLQIYKEGVTWHHMTSHDCHDVLDKVFQKTSTDELTV